MAGDISSLDHGIAAHDVDLYWSTNLVYHDESDPDFPIVKEINDWLCKNQIIRITHAVGDIWLAIFGKVPSGQLTTSHQDSVAMSRYWTRFCVNVFKRVVKHMREILERHFVDKMYLIVYGDDFVYNKGVDKAGNYFSGELFKQYLKKYHNVDLRDLEDGVPFLSVAKDGYLIVRGVTFLRYQFVRNPYYNDPRYPGQCRYLPFRETREIMIRAAYSREAKPREPLDVLLSLISHAYGTYASNKDAYDRLMILYENIYRGEGYEQGTLAGELERRASSRDMGKIRQMGLTPEEISRGFPTWETLIKKNTYDAIYQNISQAYSCDNIDHFDYDDYLW